MLLCVFMSCSLSSYFLMDFAAAFLPWRLGAKEAEQTKLSFVLPYLRTSHHLLCELHIFALDM